MLFGHRFNLKATSQYNVTAATDYQLKNPPELVEGGKIWISSSDFNLILMYNLVCLDFFEADEERVPCG